MEQGVALLGAGRFHEALQQFGLAARQQPLAAEPRVGLSQACQGIGDGWAATAWLSDACRVAPQRAELWLELVKLLTQQQREGELEPLLRRSPGPASAEHRRCCKRRPSCYLRGKLYAQALAPYERLYALQPGDRATLLHYGFCLEQTGAVEPAVARYREAIALDPSFFEAHVDLSGVLWRIEEFDGRARARAHGRWNSRRSIRMPRASWERPC